MSKQWFRRFLPEPEQIKRHRILKYFGPVLNEVSLWQFRRREVARGVAIGLFFACIPIPTQMLCVFIFALILRANLPMALLFIWVSNPLTLTPMLYLGYHIGAHILHDVPHHFRFHPTWHWISEEFAVIWKPLYFGSVLMGLVAGALGYVLTYVFWRYSILKQWQERHHT